MKLWTDELFTLEGVEKELKFIQIIFAYAATVGYKFILKYEM